MPFTCNHLEADRESVNCLVDSVVVIIEIGPMKSLVD